MPFIFFRLGSLDQADEQEKDYRADDSHYQLSDQSVSGQAQQAEYPAAEERADNSHDQINQHAHAVAFYDLSGEETDKDSDQDFPEQPHRVPPKLGDDLQGAFQRWGVDA
jgi:hypothetical protein